MSGELHRPTSRVLDILEVLARNDSGMTLTELCRDISAPASSIMPFVRTLLARGYVDMDKKNMRYTLGPKTLMFSAGFAASSDVYSFALVEMQRVVDICLETCQLGILDGSNVFYIGKIESPEPLRLVSSVGKTVPACCTAIGKALLSNMEYHEVQALYPSGLPALTSQSLKTVDALFEQLKSVREGEVAVDMDESLEHLRCFALPIRFDSTIDAAISISTPDFRLDDAKKKLVQDCLAEARKAIEKYLQQVGRGFRS